jgi:hypothetical protein
VYNTIAAATTGAGAAAAAGAATSSSAINTGFPTVILAFSPTTGYILAFAVILMMVGIANVALMFRSRRQVTRVFE